MRRLWVILFVFAGIFSATAQDQIIFHNGGTFTAKIMEITRKNVIYKHLDDLDGPMYSVHLSSVHSIRYENGRQERIETMYRREFNEPYPFDGSILSDAQRRYEGESGNDRLRIAISADAGGLISIVGDTFEFGDPSTKVEFIKNNFLSIINISIPTQFQENDFRIGFSGMFNYLWKSKIGDFYLGGGLGYTYRNDHFFTFGVNVGYRFVTSSGMYYGAGVYIGGKLNDEINLDIKPILGTGYMF